MINRISLDSIKDTVGNEEDIVRKNNNEIVKANMMGPFPLDDPKTLQEILLEKKESLTADELQERADKLSEKSKDILQEANYLYEEVVGKQITSNTENQKSMQIEFSPEQKQNYARKVMKIQAEEAEMTKESSYLLGMSRMAEFDKQIPLSTKLQIFDSMANKLETSIKTLEIVIKIKPEIEEEYKEYIFTNQETLKKIQKNKEYLIEGDKIDNMPNQTLEEKQEKYKKLKDLYQIK